MHSKKRVYLIVVIVGSTVLGALVWSLLQRDTLQSVAQKAFTAVRNRDGATLLRYMAKHEADAYGVSADGWSTILREFSGPAMEGWSLVDSEQEEFLQDVDVYYRIYTFAKTDGRIATLRIEAAMTSEGPRVVGLPRNLVTCIAMMKYGRLDIKNQRLRLSTATRDCYEADGPSLKALGLHGVYLFDRQSVEPWDELVVTFRSMVRKIEARLKEQEASETRESTSTGG
jgi:hypothetical protein